jgi:cytochrome c-type biogenesis protein CcmE
MTTSPPASPPSPSRGPSLGRRLRLLMSDRRARLAGVFVVATVAIVVLAIQALGPALSFYLEPHEFLAEEAPVGQRYRVAGRVVEGSIVEQSGRPVAFTIEGDRGDRVEVNYPDGVVPNLFGPYALVIVEGDATAPGEIDADQVIIKHEDEFFSDRPPDDSISSHFVDEEE